MGYKVQVKVSQDVGRVRHSNLKLKEDILAATPIMSLVVRNSELEGRLARVHRESENGGYLRAIYSQVDPELGDAVSKFFSSKTPAQVTNTLIYWNNFTNPKYGTAYTWYSSMTPAKRKAKAKKSSTKTTSKPASTDSLLTRLAAEIKELENRLAQLKTTRETLRSL